MLPKKQFWNIRKVSTYRVQNPMKKIEIDEHVSYTSVKRELFFLIMEYLHQKCIFFWNLNSKNDSWMDQDHTPLISI